MTEDIQTTTSASERPVTADTSSSNPSRLGSCRSTIWEKSSTVLAAAGARVRQIITGAEARWRKAVQMIGPREKGTQGERICGVSSIYQGLDLSKLPGFVSYRAALIREKVLVQHALLGVSVLLVTYFGISRIEVASLNRQLREKEFILAPGVQDFTAAAPQRVPDSYVHGAAMDFLSTLGNVNPANIEEQYGRLAESMNPALRVRFQAEAGDWAGRVRRDNISEVMSVTRKEIKTDGLGTYHVKAFARCDTYAGSEVLGARNEVIEMDLVLVPPRADRRWFLEITSLTRSSEKTYQARLSMQEKPHE